MTNKDNKTSSAYLAGELYYNNCKPTWEKFMPVNPYCEGTQDFDDWLQGWDDAEDKYLSGN